MITPPLQLKENERVLLLALDQDGAANRYNTLVASLEPFGYHVIEGLGSCILASITINNLTELETILLGVLGRRDISFVIQNSDELLTVQAIIHRANDDNEIRSMSDLWKPVWLK